MMYGDLYYDYDLYRQREHRKAQIKELLDGISDYALTELMKSNTDYEKLHRAVRAATALEDEYERMGGDL